MSKVKNILKTVEGKSVEEMNEFLPSLNVELSEEEEWELISRIDSGTEVE